MIDVRARVVNAFTDYLNVDPDWIIRSPGRVNLIGEHTDYNDGFVLPMAIDRAVYIAGKSNNSDRVELYSLDYDMRETFSIEEIIELKPNNTTWIEYIKGTMWALKSAGYPLNGWTGVVAGDVPIGAGLSSSAALELATARACQVVSGFLWDETEMALLSQRAENQWVGVQCGIMDQMISARGLRGHALLFDCRSLEGRLVSLPPNVSVVVLDTGTRRGLVDSAYNERRAQCEDAASAFGVNALRDIDLAELSKKGRTLDPVTLRRARHVVSENARTQRAALAMELDNAIELGELMNDSHISLRDDFEVSSVALDEMVQCAHRQPGCLGARMTGAGFGGCAVALVETLYIEEFTRRTAEDYQSSTGNSTNVYVCSATNGAERL